MSTTTTTTKPERSQSETAGLVNQTVMRACIDLLQAANAFQDSQYDRYTTNLVETVKSLSELLDLTKDKIPKE